MTADHTALDVLAEFPSWRLDRVSAATLPQDIVVTVRRQGQEVSEAEASAIAGLIRGGVCFRCRIGRARFYFGTTAIEAAERAAEAERAKQITQEAG